MLIGCQLAGGRSLGHVSALILRWRGQGELSLGTLMHLTVWTYRRLGIRGHPDGIQRPKPMPQGHVRWVYFLT